MTIQILFSILAIIYIGLLFWLNLGRKSQNSEDDFIIAGKNVGKFMTAASLSTGVRDASGIVIWITFAILYGLNVFVIAIGVFLAWYLLSLSAKRIHNIAREKEYITFSDYIVGEIGKKTGFVVSILTIMTAFFLCAAQLNIAGEIVSRIYDIPLGISIVFVTLIVFVYLMFGGYGSVVKTDYLQWGLIIFSLVAIIPLFFMETTGSINLAGIIEPDFTLLFGIAGIAFLSIYAAPDAWQRIFSAKSGEDAQEGLVWGSPFFFGITLLLVVMGMLLGNIFGGLPEGNILFELFSADGSPLVMSLLGIFFVTAMMSTLDTQAFLLAQTISKNFFPNLDQKKLIRYLLAGLLIVLGVVAFTILDIITFLFSAVGIISIVAPLVIVYNLKPKLDYKKMDLMIAGSLLIGLGVFGYLFFTGQLSSILLNLVPPLVTLGVLILAFGYKYFIRRR